MLSLTPAERLQMLQDTHGIPVTTFDIDIVHRRTHDNVERLMKALESLDAYYRHEPERLLRPTGTSSAPQPHRDVLAQPQWMRKQNNTWLASFQLAWKRSCGELRSALRVDFNIPHLKELDSMRDLRKRIGNRMGASGG